MHNATACAGTPSHLTLISDRTRNNVPMLARADQKATIMPANISKHDETCCCIISLNFIPCVGPCLSWMTFQTVHVQNYQVMKTFIKVREREQLAGLAMGMAPQPQVMTHGQ